MPSIREYYFYFGVILAVVGAGATVGSAIFWGAYRLGQIKSDQDRAGTRLGDHDVRLARIDGRLDAHDQKFDDHDQFWRDYRLRRHDDPGHRS